MVQPRKGKTMLAKLIEVLDSPEYDEEGELAIVQVASGQAVFHMQLAVWLSDRTQQVWQIDCHRPREHQILFEQTEQLWIEQKHPLLISYQHPWQRLNCYGRATNAQEVIGALYQAQFDIFGHWRPLTTYLNNGLSLADLVTSGAATFANGPAVVMQAYADVLHKYGLDTSLHGDQSTRISTLAVLYLHHSFVIAERFTAERMG